MKLKLKNIENFTFDEASHTYELGGKLLTGVTTVLGVRAKDFLKWWTVKLMFETLVTQLKEVQGITQEKWIEILGEAKKAHTVKSKEALMSGRIAHDMIEKYIKETIRNEESFVLNTSKIEDEKVRSSVCAFMDWESKNKVEWLASELKLPSLKNMFAGTIDAVARINGVLTVVDFKTSNQMSEDYNLQTAAYYILLDENLEEGEERPVERLILRIPKDGSGFETKVVDTPLGFDCETFIHCREIYRWNLMVERLKKEEKIKI